MSAILNSWHIFFLSILAFFTRFFNLGFPPKVVFDEAHFGLYATKYLSQQYYFDIHPPLGKMMFAIVGFFKNIKPGFEFTPIEDYGDFNFLALRFLSALFGSLLVLLIYFFVKELGFSKRIAFVAAFLVLFDNALIAQSQFILIDIFLIFFIFLSLYLFLLTNKYKLFSLKWYFFNFLTGLSLGLTISIKWTGLGVLAIILLSFFIKEPAFTIFKKENLVKIFSFIFLPFFIYFLIFAVHFYLLPFACLENCGYVYDRYYFLEESMGIFNYPPDGNIFQKFFELNLTMFATKLLGEPTAFYYQSDWHTWPFMIRPVYYYNDFEEGKYSFPTIILLGNPFVWWAGVIGIIGFLYLLTRNYFLKFKIKLFSYFHWESINFLLLSYFTYFLFFGSISRFMAIYHYLPALIFSIIIFAVFFEEILRQIKSQVVKNILFFGFLALIFLGFLFFAPLTYGIPLTESEFLQRMWLPTWHSSL